MEKALQENLSKLGSLNTGALLQSLGLSQFGGEGEGNNGGLNYGDSGLASGSAAGRTSTDASSGNPPRGKAAGGTNPTNAGPEVGEDA